MEIVHKDVSDLTRPEFRTLHRNTFGDDGLMQGELERCRDYNYGRVIMIYSDGPRRTFIGWVLLVPVRIYGAVAATRWVMSRSKYTAMFYVNSRHRRKGYGKELMKEVKAYDENPHVLPHDEASQELFSSFKVQVMMEDKKHMRRGKPKIA